MTGLRHAMLHFDDGNENSAVPVAIDARVTPRSSLHEINRAAPLANCTTPEISADQWVG